MDKDLSLTHPEASKKEKREVLSTTGQANAKNNVHLRTSPKDRESCSTIFGVNTLDDNQTLLFLSQ